MIGSSVKAVVFDAFGTLVTPVSRAGPYQKLGRAAGADPRSFRTDAMTLDIDVGMLAARYGRADLAAVLLEEVSREAGAVELFPDSEVVIAELEREGIPYAVCSNLGHGYGDRVRRLTPGAVAHVFSYECGASKPDPAIYATTVRAIGYPASEILFVGDTPKADVEGPTAFGMRAESIDRRAGDTLDVIVRRVLSDAAPGRNLFR